MEEIKNQLDEIFVLLNESDVSNRIALASLFVASLAVIITVVVNVISNKHYIDSKAPQLTFILSKCDYEIYLSIKNTGETAAKNINIDITLMKNNGDNREIYNPFKDEFDLYPEEMVKGVIAYSGQNLETQIFPQIYVQITYQAMNTKKIIKYSRNISFLWEAKPSEEINIYKGIEDKLDSLMYSQNRIANYIEGRTFYTFDRANAVPHSSLKKDMIDVVNRKRSNKNRKCCQAEGDKKVKKCNIDNKEI